MDAIERHAVSLIDIRPVGDTAVVARLGDEVNIATVRQAAELARAIRIALKGSALDVVPAYASVFVQFDPLSMQLAEAMASVRGAFEAFYVMKPPRAKARPKKRTWTVSVAFGGDNGPDLEESAALLGLTPKRLVDRLCRLRFEVAFLGFLAGFPYLIGLPPDLALPRLLSPRKAVAPGSVAIAERQCGIYPRQSPGGWRLLGRTRAPLFDPMSEPASLFAPGDIVRFAPERNVERTSAKLGRSARIAS